MTGIHHTAPVTYLHSTRERIDATTRAARRPSRLRLAVRRVTGRDTSARLPRWVDVTPATTAR